MKNEERIRQRYMRDALPVRLGGLAANLARISSFADHAGHHYAVESMIEESKFFIEWVAPEASLNQQVELINLQRQLVRWQHSWAEIWEDSDQRASLAQQAQAWSDQVLNMSGLLS